MKGKFLVNSDVYSMQHMSLAINKIKESSNETFKIMKIIDDMLFKST